MAQKRIFISYRRSDAAGRLYDYLKDYFGSGRLFFDVDTIQVGTNFEQKINTELDNSDAVLVLSATSGWRSRIRPVTGAWMILAITSGWKRKQRYAKTLW